MSKQHAAANPAPKIIDAVVQLSDKIECDCSAD